MFYFSPQRCPFSLFIHLLSAQSHDDEFRTLSRLLGARATPFSSFECTAGSQVMEIFSIDADKIEQRLCLLRDVCIIGGELTYFLDPVLDNSSSSNMRLSAFDGPGMFFSGQRAASFKVPSRLRRVIGPRPSNVPLAPNDRLYMQSELSFPSGWGHVLVDTIVPAYAAAAVYGVSIDDVQHVGVDSCATTLTANEVSPYSFTFASTSCEAHFERFYKHLMHWPYLNPPHADTCFHAYVVGQESMFSLAGDQLLSRGPTARALRAKFHASYGVPMDARPLSAHHVVVWEMKGDYAQSMYTTLCDDVRAWAAAIDQSLPVTCVKPADMTIPDQLRLVTNASVVVAEHGSTTYAAMFNVPGSSIIITYPEGVPWAKEARTLLFILDVQAFFISQQKAQGGEGVGMLQLALDRSGRRLNI